MKKLQTKTKLTSFFIAFLVIALVFLAVGIGTLGAFSDAGGDFELRAPAPDAEGQTQNSTVVFRLTPTVTETYLDEEGKEQTRSINLQIDDVYLYVDAIYTEAGTPAELSLRRSSSSNTEFFGGQLKARLENFYTDETPAEDGSSSDNLPPLQKDALYRWIHPFTFTTNWQLSTYDYWELSSTSGNVRVAEVLFVGRPTSTVSEHNADRYIVSASVYSATPDTGENAADARVRAEALLDGDINTQVRQALSATGSEDGKKVEYPTEQDIPTDAQTSYDTFVKDEYYSLLTITEMRVGGRYTTDINNLDTNVYHVESVYNVLGMDLVALGTAMFGVCPFGLRFMPMLFSFGILVLGFFFVRKLFKSDRAGFLFSVLYALCDLSFSLGHVGTPLTAGLFFVLLAAYLVDSFYRKGMKKVGIMGVAPLVFGGLSAAAAICVNGVMLIPVLAVCVLYAAGMIRQAKANRYYLDKAIAACEALPEDEEGKRDTSKVAKVVAENRYKTVTAGVAFPVTLILGTIIFSLLFMIPVYYALIKFYDDPVSPSMNLFSVGWKAFAGGFVGKNELGGVPSAWNPFYRLFTGAGDARALTVAVINPVAALIGLFGLGYAIYKVVMIAKNFSVEGKQLRRIAVPLAGLVVSLIAACFGGTLGFIFLAYIFAFMLAAYAAEDCMNFEGTAGKAAKIATITALVLLAVCFMLLAIFTFSVPVPAGFLGNLF